MTKNTPPLLSFCNPATQYGVLAGVLYLVFSLLSLSSLFSEKLRPLASLGNILSLFSPLLIVGFLYGVRSCGIACGVAMLGAATWFGYFNAGFLTSIMVGVPPAEPLMFVPELLPFVIQICLAFTVIGFIHRWSHHGRATAALWYILMAFGIVALAAQFSIIRLLTESLQSQWPEAAMLPMLTMIMPFWAALNTVLSFIPQLFLTHYVVHKIAARDGKTIIQLPFFADFKVGRFGMGLFGAFLSLAFLTSGILRVICINVAIYIAGLIIISGFACAHGYWKKKNKSVLFLSVFWVLSIVLCPSWIIFFFIGLSHSWKKEQPPAAVQS